jgi:hypothetical protein
MPASIRGSTPRRQRQRFALDKTYRMRTSRRAHGLRFDKVAVGLIDHVKRKVRGAMAPGTVVCFTVTAPIRQDAKTTAAIEAKILALLKRRAERMDRAMTMCANRVRIRVVRSGSGSARRILGFVHNPGVDARGLLDAATSAGTRIRR